jgi:hypothetical protein
MPKNQRRFRRKSRRRCELSSQWQVPE